MTAHTRCSTCDGHGMVDIPAGTPGNLSALETEEECRDCMSPPGCDPDCPACQEAAAIELELDALQVRGERAHP